MNKNKFYYLILIFGLLSCSISIKKSNSNEDDEYDIYYDEDEDLNQLNLYDDTLHNFRFNYPENWIIPRDEQNNKVIYVREKYTSNLDVKTNFEVQVNNSSQFKALPEYVDSVINVWENDILDIKNIKLLSNKKILFKEFNAIELTATGDFLSLGKNFKLKWKKIILKKDMFYELTSTSKAEKFDNSPEIMDSIFNSFEFY